MPRSTIEDPLKNSNFLVEVDGFAKAGCTEVTGLERTTEVIKYREGGDNAQPRVSAGTTDFGPITLKRGILPAAQNGVDDFRLWLQAVHNVQAVRAQAKEYRRDLDIRVPNRDGTTGALYRVYNAWPSAWKGGDLNAMNNDTWIEELTIQNEGVERVI